MKFTERTFESPAANLACDEALLDLAEETGEEVLRVWESPVHFVVLGYGNRPEVEVDLDACAKRGVPVLRRCSGGGTVVQGPGCLSYAVCVRMPDEGPLTTVTGTNRWMMDRLRSAMAGIIDGEVSTEGCTDLAVLNGLRRLKFSGNAQRRRRQAVLFHGTILYAFDLAMIGDLLRFPSKQPEYRDDRGHLDFVTNVSVAREAVVKALKQQWNAEGEVVPWPEEQIRLLAASRYGVEEWNRAR